MQKQLLGFQGWLLLLAVGLLSPLAAAADRSPFDAVVARVGRGASVGSGVLISREGLLVTSRSMVDAKGKSWVVLDGVDYPATEVSLPDLRDLAVLAITPPENAEFHTLALGVGSRVSPGTRVLVVGPSQALGGAIGAAIETRETLARDIEMDDATGAHYLRLELPYVSALAGAPVCDPEDHRLLALIVPDPSGQLGCRAMTVDSLKEELFDAGRSLRARIAPGLKGGDVGSAGPVSADGLLHRSQVLEWSFPIRSGTQTQKIGTMLSIQAWRDISGCQMAPLTPLRSYAGGGNYFATVDGVMYAVEPENQKMIWRYEANDGGMAVQAPAVAEDNVFLATGNLGLLAESNYTGDLLVDLVINLFGINQRNSISLNQGTLHAVDRRTGQFKWMYETRMLGEPQVVESRLCFGGLGVYGALDTGTGKEVWIHKDNDRGRDANWYCLKAGPDGVLYGVVVPVRVEGAGTLKDRLRLEGRGQVRAVAMDAATGNVRWKTDLFDLRKPTRRPMATAVMSDGDGSLYIVCGQEVFVLEPTGRVRNHFTQKSAPFSERIAVSEGVIFLAGEGNTMVALDGTTGTPLWTFSKPRAPVVSPVAQDGMVYIGSLDANLYAVDEKTGRLVWRFECDRRISGRPLVEQGKLLVASDEGRIWRLRLPQP